MKHDTDERALLVEVCRLLYRRNLIIGPGGNVSVKRDDGGMLITPSGYLLAEMTPDVLVEIDSSGNYDQEGLKPSSEHKIHAGLYEKFPDASAIVHAHPPTVLALSATDVDFNTGVTADMAYYGHRVSVLECPPAGEFDDRVLEAQTPVIVVRTHGTLIAGRCLSEAFHLTEMLETYARCLFIAGQVGIKHTVPAEYMEKWAKETPPTVFRDECLSDLL